jgi:hypothetical protein
MSLRFNSRRRFRAAGMTSLELALTFGLFFTLALGIFDMVRYFSAQQGLTVLANAAARVCVATVNENTQCLAFSNAWISFYAPLLDPTLVNFQGGPQWGGDFNWAGLTVETVTVTYNFTSITPGLSALTGPITATVSYQY